MERKREGEKDLARKTRCSGDADKRKVSELAVNKVKGVWHWGTMGVGSSRRVKLGRWRKSQH
jgi:hypothetical protein